MARTHEVLQKMISDRQAHAVIPPRKNAKPWKDSKNKFQIERNDLLQTVKHLAEPYENGRVIIPSWFGGNQDALHQIIR